MRTQPMYENLVERIEDNPELDAMADAVDRASSALGDGTAYEALRGEWSGHALHPVLTDLPIGCWVSAGLLDLLGGRSSRRAAQRLVGIGLLATPLTTLTGLADYRTMPDRPTMRVGAVHAVGNTAAALAYYASWRRRRSGRHLSGVGLGMIGGGLVAFTGYLGGHMSFARSTGTGPRGTMHDAPVSDGHADLGDLEELIPSTRRRSCSRCRWSSCWRWSTRGC
jgi:uncharacterized membrane protein